jgi:propanol-preferring alcohol dehydrogenase
MTKMMRALQVLEAGVMPEIVEVPIPEPGPGQVRLRTAGSGLCHSDLYVIQAKPSYFPLPLTIGHEPTGWVDAVGPGVKSVREGEAYALYFPWGCGHCARCAHGHENICEEQFVGPGAGHDGGMADYILVDDPRHLVPLGSLDPITMAPLMCAGITTYHAIKDSLPRMTPGSAVVLIGIGGLGHIAIQILKAMTAVQIIAVDNHPDKLHHALELGAHHALTSDPDTAAQIKQITGGIGAAVVLDMVGTDGTLALGAKVLARRGELKIIGVAGGTLPVRFHEMARDSSVTVPYAGTIPELYEVLELAKSGFIIPEVEKVSFENVLAAYERLEHGKLRGRAVLVPTL